MTTQIFTRLALTAATTLAATGVMTAQPQAAQAACVSSASCIVTVNGADYSISSETGKYGDLLTQIQAQPWWGNATAALQAAADVKLVFLGNGFVDTGMVFGVQEEPEFKLVIQGANWIDDPSFGSPAAFEVFADKSEAYNWAIATPVTPTPIPTPALLPGLVGMGIAAYRKHKLASSTEA